MLKGKRGEAYVHGVLRGGECTQELHEHIEFTFTGRHRGRFGTHQELIPKHKFHPHKKQPMTH